MPAEGTRFAGPPGSVRSSRTPSRRAHGPPHRPVPGAHLTGTTGRSRTAARRDAVTVAVCNAALRHPSDPEVASGVSRRLCPGDTWPVLSGWTCKERPILCCPAWRLPSHRAMCGRRVRGFAIDLVPELVRTGRAHEEVSAVAPKRPRWRIAGSRRTRKSPEEVRGRCRIGAGMFVAGVRGRPRGAPPRREPRS
jgi:hypothetical protein